MFVENLYLLLSIIGRLKHNILAPHVLMYIYNGIVQPRLYYDYAIVRIMGVYLPA